jgi:PKD domain-containing protein
MRRTLFRLVPRSLLLVGLVACGDVSLDPLPLQISIQASRVTAAPGDPVSFVVTAQGGDLVGVEIDYGDNTADQRGTAGARTAQVTFSHAFSAAGAYRVRATVMDALAGSRDAEVEIRIQ